MEMDFYIVVKSILLNGPLQLTFFLVSLFIAFISLIFNYNRRSLIKFIASFFISWLGVNVIIFVATYIFPNIINKAIEKYLQLFVK